MRPLTDKQQEVLTFIEGWMCDHQRPPNMGEVAAHLGLASRTGAKCHVYALERKGCLWMDGPHIRLSIHPVALRLVESLEIMLGSRKVPQDVQDWIAGVRSGKL